ncbi:YczE/YyaS/YitT family protein [Haloplasma contractile]|uniref:Permease protein n=1 Tax=Haloplasma contractile SSD-17B TaxID=1033810 RepID=U2DRI9_9MOLU|nr:hypothetical protein [Haloplasma contractile]ERJ11192.1 putative permease protein [Haloplasma contractile SSD-17B]
MKDFTLKNIALYLLAINLMAIGISCYLVASIGYGSWDILHANLTYFGLDFGLWVAIVGVITVITATLIHFQWKFFAAIISATILGQLINLWSRLFNAYAYQQEILVLDLGLKIVVFTAAITALGSGISLLVLSKLPPTPPDVLMVSLMKRFHLKYSSAKTITEVIAFSSAIIIGIIAGEAFGGVGVGTIITLFGIGLVVQYSSELWKRLFNIDPIVKE